MFSTYLSITKQANSSSLFPASASVLQSRWKPNQNSLSLWNKIYPLAISPHRATFPFLRAMSTSITFSGPNGTQSLCSVVLLTSPACCHLLGETLPLPTQKHSEETKTAIYRQRAVCLYTQSSTHIYGGSEVMISRDLFGICLYFIF